MPNRIMSQFLATLLAILVAGTAPAAAQSPTATPASSPTDARTDGMVTDGPTGEGLGSALMRLWFQIQAVTDLTEIAVADVPTPRQALQCDSKRGLNSVRDAWQQPDGHGTPDEALAEMLSDGFVIPVRGYQELARDNDAVLYGFRDRGKVKVAIRVTSAESGGWIPEWLADCGLSEYGRKADMRAGVWLWANRDGRTIQEQRGLAHCGQQSLRFLWWTEPSGKRRDERIYVRDPEGQFRDQWQAPYLRFTRLPNDARNSGYRRDGATIWMAANRDSIYIKDGKNVQRWPRIPRDSIGCA